MLKKFEIFFAFAAKLIKKEILLTHIENIFNILKAFGTIERASSDLEFFKHWSCMYLGLFRLD